MENFYMGKGKIIDRVYNPPYIAVTCLDNGCYWIFLNTSIVLYRKKLVYVANGVPDMWSNVYDVIFKDCPSLNRAYRALYECWFPNDSLLMIIMEGGGMEY